MLKTSITFQYLVWGYSNSLASNFKVKDLPLWCGVLGSRACFAMFHDNGVDITWYQSRFLLSIHSSFHWELWKCGPQCTHNMFPILTNCTINNKINYRIVLHNCIMEWTHLSFDLCCTSVDWFQHETFNHPWCQWPLLLISNVELYAKPKSPIHVWKMGKKNFTLHQT